MTARKRELIEPHKGDRRYARRDAKGHFTEKQVAVGRSLAANPRVSRWHGPPSMMRVFHNRKGAPG